MNIPPKKKIPLIAEGQTLAFVMLVTCFALWGALNNMTDTLVPAFAKIFMMEATAAAYVQVSFYGAYAILAIPAAIIIRKYAYRNGILVGLGFYMIGAFGYIPSAILQDYNLFLTSIFILASGLSVLETTCNPFVIAMGSRETAIQRLNFAQSFNPIGSLAGLIIAKFVILANLDTTSVKERLTLPAEELSALRENELYWVCVPYVSLIIVAMVIWVYFLKNKSSFKESESKRSIPQLVCALMKNRLYRWGVFTQFFYVGLQIGAWTWTVRYIKALTGVNESAASNYMIYSLLIFMAMRWFCTFLMRSFRPVMLMRFISILGIGACLGTIYLPTQYAIYSFVAISGGMSLMFPTIYGISLEKLDDQEVKLGAAGLIMAILGGAVFTPWMGNLIDNHTLNCLAPMFEGAEAAVRTAYFVPVLCFIVIFIYSLYVIKVEKEDNNKSIKV